jgi:hypothetical protein
MRVDPESRDCLARFISGFSDVQSHIAVRCFASPRNDQEEMSDAMPDLVDLFSDYSSEWINTSP